MSEEKKKVRPSKLKERAWTVAFMLIASFVFTSAVSLTFLSTKSFIAENEKLFLQKAVLRAANFKVPTDKKAVVENFNKHIKEILDSEGNVRYFQVYDENKSRIGCVIPCKGKGLWGTISAVVGFAVDCKTLTGVDFTSHNETPGLGGRISEPWFGEQFKGKYGPFKMVPEKTRSTNPGSFDAITGATITSTAVLKMLNTVCNDVDEIVKHKGGR